MSMAITFNPASRNFGNVLVNTTSSALSIAISGTVGAVITGPSSPFSWDQPSGTAVIPASGTLNVNVTFAPTTNGAASPAGALTANDGSSCALNGTGVLLTFSPTSFDFGNVLVTVTSPGQSIAISGGAGATITGPSSPFSWDQPSGTAVIPASGTLNVNVSFAPTTTGAVSPAGAIKGTDGSSCALNGTGGALAFSPTSLNFGGVDTGSQTQLSLTITNPSGSAFSVGAPAGASYTMSPSPAQVPANGSLTVTVTFSPVAAQSYSGTISGGGGQCALWGLGQTMADKFESEGDTTEGAAAPAGDANTPGDKYYQLVVPNFVEMPLPPAAVVQLPTDYVGAGGTAAAGSLPAFSTTTGGGTSFLRLGSSPDSSLWNTAPFTNSVNLARLVGDPIAVALSENMSLSGTPSALVGNVDNPNGSTLTFTPSTPITIYNKGQDRTTGSDPSGTFTDAFVDGTPPMEPTPFGGGTTFGSAQDPNFLLGFADDLRWRGPPETPTLESLTDANNNLTTNNNVLSPEQTLISNVPVPNVNANRQAETLKLLTKGGWWDHSDGNHISTTMGDKVEVVQGNYKLVVLGRQPAPTAPPITNIVDLQGCIQANTGLLGALSTWYDNGADLTNVGTITSNLTNSSGVRATDVAQKFAYQVQVWLMTQNSFITDLSGGHFQEQYPSPTPCIKTIEYSQDNKGEWTLYQDNTQGNLITRYKGRTVDLFQGSSRETYVGTSSNTVLYASGNETGTTAGDLPLDPTITSKTWAQSVYNQTGSEDKPIGWNSANSSPNWIMDTEPNPVGPAPGSASKGDVVSLTWAMRVRTYQGSPKAHVKQLYSETHADSIQSYTFGESSVTINGVLNTFEVVMGIKESIQLGATFNIRAAAELTVGVSRTSTYVNSWSFAGGAVDAAGTAMNLRAFGTTVHGALTTVGGTLTRCWGSLTSCCASNNQVAVVHNNNAAVVIQGQ
jgi:Abnormal spindle-like microcephaly-assoc'd, ASPM-SPD-2-Hydin